MPLLPRRPLIARRTLRLCAGHRRHQHRIILRPHRRHRQCQVLVGSRHIRLMPPLVPCRGSVVRLLYHPHVHPGRAFSIQNHVFRPYQSRYCPMYRRQSHKYFRRQCFSPCHRNPACRTTTIRSSRSATLFPDLVQKLLHRLGSTMRC